MKLMTPQKLSEAIRMKKMSKGGMCAHGGMALCDQGCFMAEGGEVEAPEDDEDQTEELSLDDDLMNADEPMDELKDEDERRKERLTRIMMARMK